MGMGGWVSHEISQYRDQSPAEYKLILTHRWIIQDSNKSPVEYHQNLMRHAIERMKGFVIIDVNMPQCFRLVIPTTNHNPVNYWKCTIYHYKHRWTTTMILIRSLIIINRRIGLICISSGSQMSTPIPPIQPQTLTQAHTDTDTRTQTHRHTHTHQTSLHTAMCMLSTIRSRYWSTRVMLTCFRSLQTGSRCAR